MAVPAARLGALPRLTEANRRWWTLAGTCMGLFVLMLDSTVINVALPDIARDLDATTAGLQWVMNAYLLVLAAFVVSAGRVGDILGRRRVFVIGMAAFAGGSVLAAMSDGEEVLVAGRVLQGLGGAALLGLSLAIVSTVFSGRRARPRARHLGRRVGARFGPGTPRRRRPRRGGQLALAVLAEPALLPARRGARARLDRGAARRDGGAPDRRRRRGHGGSWAGRDRDRPRGGQGVGLDLGGHPRRLRGGRRPAGGVLVHRAPRPVADRGVRPVPQRAVLRSQRRRVLLGRLLLGADVPAAAIPADRPRPRRARGGRADPAGDRADDRDLPAGRTAHRAVRSPPAHDRRHGAWHRRPGRARAGRRVERLRAAVRRLPAVRDLARLRLRADVDGGDDGHAARRRRASRPACWR